MAIHLHRFTRSFMSLVTATGLVVATQWVTAAMAEPPPAAAPTDGVVVNLLDAGTTPRRKLRFAPKIGAQQTSIMTMDMQIAMSIAGQQPPQQQMPAQKMTFQIEVDDVKPNGDIAYHFEYTDIEVVDTPRVTPAIANAIQDAVKPLKGMTGSGVTSDRGITRTAQINVPEDAPPMLKQLLSGMKVALKRLSSPVPEQAVGVGAKWEVIQDVIANGMQLTQTSVHEVTALNDAGFSMSTTMKQSAEPQEVKNPALPPSIKMKLDSLNTTGNGNSDIVTDRVMPRDASVTANSEASMSMVVGEQEQKMKTTTVIKIKIESP